MDGFELIECFGKRLGMTLVRDPDETYLFEVDDRAFAIYNMPECGKIVLSGDLGHPPPHCKEKLCVNLLEAQHLLQNTAGATFSIDPQTGNFSLCKVLVPTILDNDDFFSEAENFINTLHLWADIISNCRAEEAQDDDQSPYFLDSTFIHV